MGLLNQSIIHIWHTRFDDHTKKYKLFESWLAPEEKIRAEKLAIPYRQNFIISRCRLSIVEFNDVHLSTLITKMFTFLSNNICITFL